MHVHLNYTFFFFYFDLQLLKYSQRKLHMVSLFVIKKSNYQYILAYIVTVFVLILDVLLQLNIYFNLLDMICLYVEMIIEKCNERQSKYTRFNDNFLKGFLLWKEILTWETVSKLTNDKLENIITQVIL